MYFRGGVSHLNVMWGGWLVRIAVDRGSSDRSFRCHSRTGRVNGRLDGLKGCR